MSEKNSNTKKLTLVSLILMIFTSVFGFTNMPRAFYLMGYSAIPWYIFSAIFFFIPYAFMMSEYGAAFKKETGGMYSWMEKTVGGKYAFIGTFMWYASYIIWMVNVGTGIWVPLSNALFGADMTSTWSFLGLNSVQILGVLGICWVLFVTTIGSKGLNKISKITSVGGTAVALLNIVLLIGGIAVFAASGGLAEPINNIAQSLSTSPHAEYQSATGILSFMTFAIFAFGGLEAVGGLVDQTENAEKTFPKGVTISAIVISVGYAVGIFACGMFTNWNEILNSDTVHLGNIAYVLMKNLGYQLGIGFGASEAVALSMGSWVARLVGLSMFLSLTGAYFTLSYSPLKTLIQGSPKEIWPGKMGELKDGMPVYAMRIQAVIVILIISLISFGGDSASEFFTILTLMTNVAMTVPYMFLSLAFIKFKKKQLNGEIDSPFMIYKTQKMATIFSVIVTFVVGFANVFTIIQPVIAGTSNSITETTAMIGGPLVFSVVAYLLYSSYERKHIKSKNSSNIV